jgi:TonB family protein
LSRVFDARKHAEKSKSVREAAPGTAQSPKSGSHLADGSGTTLSSERPLDADSARLTQQGPIVRSLLRMPRCVLRSLAPSEPGPCQATGSVEPATLILPKDPMYPAVARECSVSGRVEVQFRISPEGKVYDVKSVMGAPILARAAMEAVAARRYEPARLDGAPIDSQATTNFDFRLS